MAATDKTYRNQRVVDIVFGASCLLMLVSIIWMFADDQYRQWKVEQRDFRDVEEAMAARAAVRDIPELDKIDAAEEAIKEDRKKLDRKEKKEQLQAIEDKIAKLTPLRVEREGRYNAVKADYDSVMSLYNIAVDEHKDGVNSEAAKSLRLRVMALEKKLGEALQFMEQTNQDYVAAQKEKEAFLKDYKKAIADLEKLNEKFDTSAKTAIKKRWGWGDRFRSLPVIDGFASPTKIQQFTLEELPINYNFKDVTRFDRCMTCHQGIDRASFDQESLRGLAKIPGGMRSKLKDVKKRLAARAELLGQAGEELGFDPNYLEISRVKLDKSRISEFAAHPRLDLFVDANSPHPAEKFGCSICHAGQGSATQFNLASHTPDTVEEKNRWKKQHDWESIHYWDFPMLPKRFVESSCLKCHHQVTDLVREGSKVEAPKVFQGFNLVREFGCFGCHEISAIKSGKTVGPDLRLEPYPPLVDLTPDQRAKIAADPLNPPGNLRKVGPSLRRLAEKTNPDWTWAWIHAPRDFRPDTKMPHFYGLSNNHKNVLPQDQQAFPDAEIHAVTHYIFQESKDAIAKSGKSLPEVKPEPKDLEKHLQEGRRLFTERGCLACHQTAGTTTEGKDKDGKAIPTVHSDAHFGPNLSQIAAKLGTKPGDKESARRWLIQWIQNPTFHSPRTYMPITHLTMEEAADVGDWLLSQKPDWVLAPPEKADVDALERLAKLWLEKTMTREEARTIIKNKGLSAEEVAAKRQQKPEPDEAKLAPGGNWEDSLKWYVGKKAITQLGCFGCHEIPGFETAKPIGTGLNDWGKKDAERLAFEDIVKFVKTHYERVDSLDSTKNVEGKELNFDSGDLSAEYHHPEKAIPIAKQRAPYEEFFYDALEHHQREGFLYQKLREPRSYDFNRIRTWDERLRMPQFRFARGEAKPKEKESPEQAGYRAEAEAREAVMTFILGLLAEPIPNKYVNHPDPDKLAEVKGRQVLDKFNCAGCHQVRSGAYEFKITPDNDVLDRLQAKADDKYPADHPFPESNAWTGKTPDVRARQNPRLTTVLLHGLESAAQTPGTKNIRLTQALAFYNGDKELRNIPAAENLELENKHMISAADPFGGAFSNLLVNYLIDRDKLKPEAERIYNGDIGAARSSLPPPLLREGEKTQPGWLYRFLKNPERIRKLTFLQMPKFSLSDDDLTSLVNYFAAVDRLENPGLGLNYPYFNIPQLDKEFWQDHNQAYLKDLKRDPKAYDDRLKELKPIWEQLGKGDKNIKRGEEEWAQTDAYATDAYRLLASYDRCLNCHQVGTFPPNSKLQGPPLELASQRLRPGWLERWIASPKRLLIYPDGNNPMPANFPRNEPKLSPLFVGSRLNDPGLTTLEQARAVRDILMYYPRVIEMPENRLYQIKAGGETK